MMKTLALLAIVLTTNLQAQVWMEQYLILGVEDQVEEGMVIEEIYAPLASNNNKA